MTDTPTLEESIEMCSQLIREVSDHPAILKVGLKKETKDEMMDVSFGDPLDQIELANKLVASIDNRIILVYNSVRKVYSQRLPELRVADPLQYIMITQLLGNKPLERISDENIKKQLNQILGPKIHLLVTMTANIQSVKLEPEIMEKILKACSTALHLSDLKTKLVSFVENNMKTIAPNLSIILGAPIAAKLMGSAGGLVKLATMDTSNIRVLGSQRVSKIETDINAPPRVGHIYECDLIQNIPFDHTKDLRKRAVKWVAHKCGLAARCDLKPDEQQADYYPGKAGQMFRDKIQSMIDEELKPPAKKAARALPAPVEKSGKKRGGKRVRRMKERYAQTELRKAANRMNFGDVGDDAYQNDLGFGRSQLNAIQKLRGPQINQKTKIRLSKAAQKKLAKNQQDNNRTSSNETNKNNDKPETTTITLKAEQQGVEIFNPNAKESYTAQTGGESTNYFSNTAGFFALKKEQHQQ